MKTINSTLADKVAIITGAAQGIERAVAEALAGARNPEDFEAMGKAIPLRRWAEPEEQASASCSWCPSPPRSSRGPRSTSRVDC